MKQNDPDVYSLDELAEQAMDTLLCLPKTTWLNGFVVRTSASNSASGIILLRLKEKSIVEEVLVSLGQKNRNL